MGKIVLILLLITSSSTGQNVYFSIGTDIKNAIVGSAATDDKSALDLNLNFGMVSNKNIEISIKYERFERLDYNRFAFGAGYQIQILKKLLIVPTFEPTLIGRKGTWGGGLGYKDNKSSHLSLGLSLPFRYTINNNFAIEWQCNYLYRTDIRAKYHTNGNRISNFINIIYKINL